MDPVLSSESESERTLSGYCNTEGLSTEEKDALSVATAVNVIAFSKPPFNEPWIRFVDDNEFPVEDAEEIFNITNSLVYNPSEVIIDRKDGDNEYFFLSSEDNGEEKIMTPYPITKILKTYIREMGDPSSVLIIKYENSTGQIKTVDISKEKIVDKPIKPIGVVRIRNIKENAVNEVLDEISDYFDNSQIEELQNVLTETSTAYLGEVANLKNEGLFILTATKSSLQSFSPLPKQIVYLTKPGTSIEDEQRGKNPITRILNGIYGKGFVEEVRKNYKDRNGNDVVVYIYKINTSNHG